MNNMAPFFIGISPILIIMTGIIGVAAVTLYRRHKRHNHH
ncbi:hypothetical protein A8U91_04052 [Halomonas elongata]|uniref:Uncharacterized protein n=1 Tax=Halomonas elongata TaxID=2746 RepID=A0A1B8NYC7_HALEL|nr:hypothetical protein A8U91_04052 [Halomonas elongata]